MPWSLDQKAIFQLFVPRMKRDISQIMELESGHWWLFAKADLFSFLSWQLSRKKKQSDAVLSFSTRGRQNLQSVRRELKGFFFLSLVLSWIMRGNTDICAININCWKEQFNGTEKLQFKCSFSLPNVKHMFVIRRRTVFVSMHVFDKQKWK